VFSWWLDAKVSRRNKEQLAMEIRDKIPFLFSDYGGQLFADERLRDSEQYGYTVVSIAADSLLFRFIRGRGGLDVFVGPRRMPESRHELSLVLSLLDSATKVDRQAFYRLEQVARVLRPRMNLLQSAFAEDRYSELCEALAGVYDRDRVITRQREATINRTLGNL